MEIINTIWGWKAKIIIKNKSLHGQGILIRRISDSCLFSIDQNDIIIPKDDVFKGATINDFINI